MSIAAFLQGLPDDRPVALLVRHAQRPIIPDGETGHAISITDAGVRAAEELGEILGPRVVAFSTSPVPRCVQTSDAILRGANASLPIKRDALLGEPGAFVRDAELAWTTFLKLGHEAVMAGLIAGRKDLPGLDDPDVAAQALASHLLAGLADMRPGFHVSVTHDIVLAAMVARLLGVSLERTSYPAFLEPAALYRGRAGPVLVYRDRAQAVAIPHEPRIKPASENL